ncbi:hypothetical protein [Vibrio paucivorans]
MKTEIMIDFSSFKKESNQNSDVNDVYLHGFDENYLPKIIFILESINKSIKVKVVEKINDFLNSPGKRIYFSHEKNSFELEMIIDSLNVGSSLLVMGDDNDIVLMKHLELLGVHYIYSLLEKDKLTSEVEFFISGKLEDKYKKRKSKQINIVGSTGSSETSFLAYDMAKNLVKSNLSVLIIDYQCDFDNYVEVTGSNNLKSKSIDFDAIEVDLLDVDSALDLIINHKGISFLSINLKNYTNNFNVIYNNIKKIVDLINVKFDVIINDYPLSINMSYHHIELNEYDEVLIITEPTITGVNSSNTLYDDLSKKCLNTRLIFDCSTSKRSINLQQSKSSSICDEILTVNNYPYLNYIINYRDYEVSKIVSSFVNIRN